MTCSAILAALQVAIAELDASAYAQPAGATVRWVLSKQVLSPLLMPEQAGHLAFSTIVLSRPNAESERVTPTNVGRVAMNLQVAFGFRIRATEQQGDYAMLFDACRDLVALVNDEDAWAAEGDVNVVVTDFGTPRVAMEGGILVASVGFTIYHSEAV